MAKPQFAQKLNTYRPVAGSRVTGDGPKLTHTRIGNAALGVPGGSYIVPSDEIESFHTEYIKHMFGSQSTPTADGAHLRTNVQEFLTQKQLVQDGPILVDLDLRYEPTVEERIHTKEYVDDLVEMYADNISKLLVVEETTDPIHVYVTEKPDVRMEDDKTKDGIHMVMCLGLHKAGQLILRNSCVKDIANVWGDIPITNTWSDVIDEGVTKGHCNWQMYGSRKPGYDAYAVTGYYQLTPTQNSSGGYGLKVNNQSLASITIEETFERLSAQNSSHPSLDIQDGYKKEYAALVKRMDAPRPAATHVNNCIGSGGAGDANQRLLGGGIDGIMARVESIASIDQLDAEVDAMLQSAQLSEYGLRDAHDFAMALPVEYWGPGSYDRWIRSMWALRNTDPRLILTWLRISAKSPSFNFSDIQFLITTYWNKQITGNNTGLTSRSIMYWVKTDAPDQYTELSKTSLDALVQDTIRTATEVGIARVLYNQFKDTWVCTSIKHKQWYRYHNGKWEHNESGTDLRYAISTTVHDIFFQYLQETIVKKTAMMSDDVDIIDGAPNLSSAAQQLVPPAQRNVGKSDEDVLVNKISLLTEYCKRSNWKKLILTEAQELFYDPKFLERLDANPHLLCFKNGVVDFSINEFRPGQPDDYLSKCTGHDYVPIDKMVSSHQKTSLAEVREFFGQLFPREVLREYMWDHMASILIGCNDNQVFNIYNGCGCNGKSKMVELLSECLGNYKGIVPISLVIQKRIGIGGTSPELAALKALRYAVMQEPSKGDKLNEGILKELTGGDPIQARALYQDNVTFIPQFKLAVCTNTMFEIDDNSDGTWRRLHVNPFESKFCDNPYKNDEFPEADYPYQFPIDKRLKENKFESWVPALMALLVERAYVTKGLVTANDIVLAESNKYRKTQDSMLEFANEMLIETSNLEFRTGEERLTKNVVMNMFKIWYTENIGARNGPKGRDIFEYCIKRYGKYPANGWKNVCAVDETNNEDGSE